MLPWEISVRISVYFRTGYRATSIRGSGSGIGVVGTASVGCVAGIETSGADEDSAAGAPGAGTSGVDDVSTIDVSSSEAAGVGVLSTVGVAGAEDSDSGVVSTVDVVGVEVSSGIVDFWGRLT